MNKLKIFFILCLICSFNIYGYKKTTIEIDLKGGYREDNIQINSEFDMSNISDISFYDIEFNKVKSIQSAAFCNLRFFGINLQGSIDYAWILSANGSLTWPEMTGIDNFFPKSDYKDIKGHFWDYYANIGYGIKLSNPKFILMPQVGYGEFNQTIKKTKICDQKIIDTNFGIFPSKIYFQIDPSNNNYETKWWGFHYGGDFIFDSKNNFEFQIGYFYHDLFYEQRDKFLYYLTIDFLLFGGIIDQEINTESISQKHNGYGHQARGKLSYSFFDNWKIAIFGDFYYLKSNDAKIKSDEEKIRLIGNPSLEKNDLIGKSDFTIITYFVAFEINYLF